MQRIAAADLDPQPGGDCHWDDIRRADRGQVHEPHAVGIAITAPFGSSNRDPGLAHAAGADDRDQPVFLQPVGDGSYVVLPADEPAERPWQVTSGSARPCQWSLCLERLLHSGHETVTAARD